MQCPVQDVKIFSVSLLQFSEEITYDKFVEYVTDGKVKEATLLDGSRWEIKLKEEGKSSYTSYSPD